MNFNELIRITALVLSLLLITIGGAANAAFDTKTYKAQSLLNALGYNSGVVDGYWGNKTKAALNLFLGNETVSTHAELTEEVLDLLEIAYENSTGEFPIFGSIGSGLPLLMPVSTIPDTDNGWDTLIKTELHSIDVSKSEFKELDWQSYRRAAMTKPLIDHYGLGMTNGIDCHALSYDWSDDLGRPEPSAWCNFALRTSLPILGPGPIQDVLNHWVDIPIDSVAPDYTSGSSIYTRQQNYAQIATTYAFFYDRFTNQEAINKWLIDWGVNFERTRQISSAICPFNNPIVMREHKIKGGRHLDSGGCGSEKWRGSIARIALGLRLKNESIFLSGVRQLEALLAMFDQNGVYVHYATRGWDSLGYTIDVPNYLSDVALLLEGAGFDFYKMKTTSGKSVEQLIDITNSWLRDPKIAERYYVGTRNERPGEQPEFFSNISDYGSYDQWRAERQSEDHDIFLRSFHYQIYKTPSIDNWSQEIIEQTGHVYQQSILPMMYFYGWTSAVPQILTSLNAKEPIDKVFKINRKHTEISAKLVPDYRNAVLKEFSLLRDKVDFNIEGYLNPTLQNFVQFDLSKIIGLDVAYMEKDVAIGSYGFVGRIDRKLPLYIKLRGDDVILVDSTYITSNSAGDKIGRVSENFIELSFTGRLCDICSENQEITAIISKQLLVGASNEATNDGQRIIFLPLP